MGATESPRYCPVLASVSGFSCDPWLKRRSMCENEHRDQDRSLNPESLSQTNPVGLNSQAPDPQSPRKSSLASV